MTNPYATLGVERSSDQDTIRKAYKKLARKYHPDVNKDAGAEKRFKEVNAAYEVLGDAKKRQLFDEFGEVSTRPGFDPAAARAWSSGRQGGGMPFDFGVGSVHAWHRVGAAFQLILASLFWPPYARDVDDLLGSLFGAGFGGRNRPQKGADQSVELTVDFMLTVCGGERSIQLRRPDGGTDTLRVPIPAGAKDGGRVRLKGKGLPPRHGGACGDLLVNLSILQHPLLRRIGDDLEMDVPITVSEAMRGASVTIPTPTGDVKVTIPRGAGNGQRLRIKGRGIQKKRKGHLYLVLRPTVPQTEDEAILLAAEAIDEAYDGDIRASLKL